MPGKSIHSRLVVVWIALTTPHLLNACDRRGNSLTGSVLGRDHEDDGDDLNEAAECWANKVADTFFADGPCSQGYGYDWWDNSENHDRHSALAGPPTFDCTGLCDVFRLGATSVGMMRLYENIWSPRIIQRERNYVRCNAFLQSCSTPAYQIVKTIGKRSQKPLLPRRAS